jgi:type II secretory pathway predicted ATPase ExeA
MSTEVFNDSRHPFDDTPDTRFFYLNSATRAAYDRLLSDLRGHKGVVLLVGELGTGKTTLLLRLGQALEAAKHLVVLHRCAGTSFDELLGACCDELRVTENASDRMGRVRALAEFLFERLEAGTTAVILVDDAQTLADDALEDLSRLIDLEIAGRKLVQIVLAGQPELVPRLCGSKLSFLQESAISYCGLEPLDRREVGSYIQHRLQAVDDWDSDFFSSEAIERIARYAEGVPRMVNQICATALHLAGRVSGGAVSADTVEAAVRDLSARNEPAARAEAPSGNPAADTEASNEAIRKEPCVPAEAPPATGDWSPRRPDRAPGAAGETVRKIAEGARLYAEAESGPALAPFPRNLVIPSADTRAARRRGVFAPIAALLLAGVVLGGLGMAIHGIRPWPSNETLSRPMLSDAADKELEALDKDAATAVAPAPKLHPLAETTADQADPAGAPDVQPLAVGVPTLYVAHVSGSEDEAIPLDIRAVAADNGGTTALTIAISGLPEGFRFSTGRDNGDGTWSLDAEQLVGLTLEPPPNFSGRLRLTVDATARRGDGNSASASDSLVVEVAAKADVPRLDVAAATGSEGKAIPLDIRTALADADQSETLSVTISDLPDGARLSAGHDNGDDSWSLDPDELAGLTLAPPAKFSGRSEIMVAVTAREANGDSMSTTAPLQLEVARAPAAFAAAKGAFVIQLAAMRSAVDAKREASRLKDRFPELLGDARLKVSQADVNGVPYFRVRTEPVPDKAEAFQMCARLKGNQQDCMVLQQIKEAKPIAARTDGEPAGTAPISLLPREVTIALAEASTPKSVAKLQEADVAVLDFVMAREVVNREPAGPTTTFSPQDGRAFAYAKINNPGAPTQVSFVWLYDDALYATVEMEVGPSVRWRTWSSAQLSLGAWRVQIVSPDGEVLAENAFTVE